MTALFLACVLLVDPVVANRVADTPQVPAFVSFDLTPDGVKEMKALYAREARIRAELAEIAAAPEQAEAAWAKEWAGTYYTGGVFGGGDLVQVAPKAGIVYTAQGCMGVYDYNHGDIVKSFDDGLEVRWALPDREGHRFVSPRLYFVRWGQRRYLVPESRIADMVNTYNEGGHARDGMYLSPIRHEDRDAATAEAPKLPAEYAARLLKGTLKITVTKVSNTVRQATDGKEAMSQSDVELDRGSNDGVFSGMEFWIGEGLNKGRVTVTDVAARSAKGTFLCYGCKRAVEVGDAVMLGEEKKHPAFR